jgi:uroporphyrinogen III methyltransferase/synthase
MPLFGKRILVTRARAQASSLVHRIEELGGEPYEFPVIQTVAPSDEPTKQEIKEAFARLPEYDWVFFTSVNGVEYFFTHLKEQGKDVRALFKARIAAVGPATAAALRTHGIAAEQIEGPFQAEGLLEGFEQDLQAGQNVFLPRGDLARSWLPEKLREMGLHVTEADLYQTVLAANTQDDELLKLLEERAIHAITFTSSSTVTFFLEALRQMGIHDPLSLLEGVTIAVIGPLTGETATQAGLTVSFMSEKATIESLIQSLCDWKRSSTLMTL